jgi:hypothetical protein
MILYHDVSQRLAKCRRDTIDRRDVGGAESSYFIDKRNNTIDLTAHDHFRCGFRIALHLELLRSMSISLGSCAGTPPSAASPAASISESPDMSLSLLDEFTCNKRFEALSSGCVGSLDGGLAAASG